MNGSPAYPIHPQEAPKQLANVLTDQLISATLGGRQARPLYDHCNVPSTRMNCGLHCTRASTPAVRAYLCDAPALCNALIAAKSHSHHNAKALQIQEAQYWY